MTERTYSLGPSRTEQVLTPVTKLREGIFIGTLEAASCEEVLLIFLNKENIT